MEKTISFGKHNVNGHESPLEITVDLTLEGGDTERPCFSASAFVCDAQNDDCEMGGQCLEEILEEVPDMKDNALYNRIVGLWKRNHLNDMNAGTPKQEAEVKRWLGEEHRRYDYGEVCEHLKSVGLYEDNGYKYGSSWLYREISAEDLASIKEIMA